MDVGQFVISKSYSEKGKGRIIDKNTISNNTTYTIFFPTTQELLSLNENDILLVKNPLEKIKENVFDSPIAFPIRLLSEKIDSLFYQDKIISACNFSIIPLPHQVLTVNNVLEICRRVSCNNNYG